MTKIKPIRWDDQHLLLIVHHLDADSSMESRLSWFRALHAANQCDTTVLCADVSQTALDELARLAPRLKVICVPHTSIENAMTSCGLFYLTYRLWHKRVVAHVRELHKDKPFTLVHQVSYCGYREPGKCWKLDLPFVWGPLGGTQNLPWKFLVGCGFPLALREGLRNVINTIQIRYSRRVRQALQASAYTVVANREVQAAFREKQDRELPLCLETGIEHISKISRAKREPDAPLKVLWAGRLECWKGLPLLLKALAQLPDKMPIEVRILGEGQQSKRLKRLANRLRVASRIQWVGWPPYTSRYSHYDWTDVFAFTSLRDTSGTGLLESLAAGVPIIGLDHQGARDVMTPDCALAIPVRSPQQVVTDLSEAIEKVARDPDLHQHMSIHAQQRAQDFHWDLIGERMISVYGKVLSQRMTRQKLLEASSISRRTEASAIAAG